MIKAGKVFGVRNPEMYLNHPTAVTVLRVDTNIITYKWNMNSPWSIQEGTSIKSFCSKFDVSKLHRIYYGAT